MFFFMFYFARFPALLIGIIRYAIPGTVSGKVTVPGVEERLFFARLGLGTRTLSDSQLPANRQQVPYESEIAR